MNGFRSVKSVPLALVLLVLLALSVLPCAGEANNTSENTVIMAADAERVLLDYSIDTIDVVTMATETYYIVAYKNVICGRGIVIFTSGGVVVEDVSIVDSVVEAVAWGQAADRLTTEGIDAIKVLAGSPQVIETNRINLITACDSLAVLENDLNQSNTTDYAVASAFAERVMSVDQNMADISNGTKFFLKDLSEQEKMVAGVAKTANSTRKSIYKDWSDRQHAQTQVLLTLVLIVVIIVVSTALILTRSKNKDSFIKKRAKALIGKKKENIIDQLHSQDADERARSALMAGASADINESVIPHLIVLLDDPLTETKPNEHEKIRDYYFGTISNMVAPESKLVLIGTPLSTSDIFHDDRIANNPIYGYYKFPAIKSNGSPQWDKWNLDKLEFKRKEIGELMFEREYQLRPFDDLSQSFFPYSLTKYALKDELHDKKEDKNYDLSAPKGRYTYAVDPAFSQDG
ncbi:MAG TPA: hypothetical protein EYP67_03330, partial [Methanosarcinales archaeon]|nr:hypothetical protein [Methanosarcinales archaeon]